MLIVCNGMPRSASTWSVHVVVRLLESAFPGEPVEKAYKENLVQFVKGMPEQARHLVMKSHVMTPLGKNLLRLGALKVVFTWRDLGDAAASALQTFGVNEESFLDFYRTFDHALGLLAHHREGGDALLLEYEQLTAHPEEAIGQIAKYLALPGITEETVAAIAAATSLGETRRKVAEINERNKENLIATGRSWYDGETLLHRNHVNDGRSGKGREVLNASQWGRLEELCAKHGFSDLTLRQPCATISDTLDT